jgi:hypothetical protein
MCRRVHTIALGILACLTAAIPAGCDTQEDWTDTMFIHEAVGWGTSRVVFLSPGYPDAESVTDTHYVEVIWDGETIFEGWLPSVARRRVYFTGESIRLIQIETRPGEHIVEIRSGDKSCTQTVTVDRNAYHELWIGHTSDGEPNIGLLLWG